MTYNVFSGTLNPTHFTSLHFTVFEIHCLAKLELLVLLRLLNLNPKQICFITLAPLFSHLAPRIHFAILALYNVVFQIRLML